MSIESTVASPPRVKRPGRRMDAPIPASSPAAMPQPGVIKPLSLRRNFSWTLAGNLVNAACQWGVIVVLAKLG
ncbi:MAG: hypothetical protein GX621_14995, partial [Pirellulaceae bacterium]|nr:hypothetical protein [Pirellulaceae bacterium]